jgi:hypothetical protein
MKIDSRFFGEILRETIDENPLACRGALSVARVEITDEVDTLSVSLGRQSVLRVNLDFMNRHCETETQVKALLVHEFLHILLGHTLNFDHMTPELNIALDAVINAVIHRKLGPDYSSMMANYYAGARGMLKLLRPMDEEERRVADGAAISRTPIEPLASLHAALYNGTALADDVLSMSADLKGGRIPRLSGGRPYLLGDHGHAEGRWPHYRGEGGDFAMRQAVVALDVRGIFRDPYAVRPQILKPAVEAGRVPASWQAATLPLLRRLVVPDPRGKSSETENRTLMQPILNSSDRRGFLKAVWSPLIPDIQWNDWREEQRGAVQIYLDVSASMGGTLRHLVRLLAGFGGHIKRPLWAFSTEVCAAEIRSGELLTRTTGGTRLACVYDHLRKTRPKRALVITDGYVEDEAPTSRPMCHIEAIIPRDGYEDILSLAHGIPVTRLPAILKGTG